MASAKTLVIESIFFDVCFDSTASVVTKPVVTFDDVADAIVRTGAKLETSNTANFWKDIIRSQSAGAAWPASVLAEGYTGDDATGLAARASFRFVRLPVGQSTAFPAPLLPPAAALSNPHRLQSLSLPAASRLLGRKNESWLAQVAARLHLIETHLSLLSPREFVEVELLQTNVKMTLGEVDSAYRAVDGRGLAWLIAVEAKGRRDVIWTPQVKRASTALLASYPTGSIAGVIPMAIKVVGPSLLHCVEFAPDLTQPSLTKQSEGVYRLEPAVTGIS